MFTDRLANQWGSPWLYKGLPAVILAGALLLGITAAPEARGNAPSQREVRAFGDSPSSGQAFMYSGLKAKNAPTLETRKRKKKRSWYMRPGTAKRNTEAFALYLAEETMPDDYSQKTEGIDLGTIPWSAYGGGLCKRRGYSRVNCFWTVRTEVVDLVDETDQVVDEGKFSCSGYMDNWYPRARRPILKFRITESLCFWTSEL